MTSQPPTPEEALAEARRVRRTVILMGCSIAVLVIGAFFVVMFLEYLPFIYSEANRLTVRNESGGDVEFQVQVCGGVALDAQFTLRDGEEKRFTLSVPCEGGAEVSAFLTDGREVQGECGYFTPGMFWHYSIQLNPDGRWTVD